MKPACIFLVVVALSAGGLVSCSKKSVPDPIDREIAKFVLLKQSQAYACAQVYGAKLPGAADELFAAILADDLSAATNHFARLDRQRIAPPAPWEIVHDWMSSTIGLPDRQVNTWAGAWEPIREAHWAYFLSKNWERNRLKGIVREIINTVGTNSIYFGGTDVGRFAITAAMESHEQGRPFFVLTQNQLCDGWYREYASMMFSNQISIPTHDDFAELYRQYLVDAKERQQVGKLRKDENIAVGADGVISISGSGAYWEFTGRLVKAIIDQNQNHPIYIEQSEPLHWMYPHLVPTGPIFRFDRQPLDRLADAVVLADHAYWSNQCAALIGDWTSIPTSVSNICAFVRRVYVQKDLTGFTGDPEYLRKHVTQEYISRLRRSTADLYHWRCLKVEDVQEKERMWGACWQALWQAWALAPGSFETTTYFKNVLVDVKCFDEAITIMEIASALNPEEKHYRNEIERIKKMKSP